MAIRTYKINVYFSKLSVRLLQRRKNNNISVPSVNQVDSCVDFCSTQVCKFNLPNWSLFGDLEAELTNNPQFYAACQREGRKWITAAIWRDNIFCPFLYGRYHNLK